MKRCPKCSLTKPTAEFSKNSRAADGLQCYCKPCHSAAVCLSQKRHPEAKRARQNKYAETHRERVNAESREYKLAHPERRKAAQAKYQKNNPAKGAAKAAKYRYGKVMRTVAWADTNKINMYYDATRAFDFFNPFSMHEVDHIIPLHGERVSGLRVHNNLQILTSEENKMKSNTFKEL